MEHFYAEFTREREFVHNLSENTLEGYRWAWKAFETVLTGKTAITKAEIVEHIGVLRSKGSTPVTINTYLRSLNAFFRWLNVEGRSGTRIPIPKLKEQQKVILFFLNLTFIFRGQHVIRRLHANEHLRDHWTLSVTVLLNRPFIRTCIETPPPRWTSTGMRALIW